MNHAGPAFFMAGSGDNAYYPKAMKQIRDHQEVSTWIAEGADHSLEFPDDPLRSLPILLAGMDALSTFLTRVLPTQNE
jgi:hypothetical protein